MKTKKNIRLVYDYSQLFYLMKIKKISQNTLARKSNISRTSLNLSLNNKRPFKQDEIIKLSKVLEIPENIDEYFFKLKV